MTARVKSSREPVRATRQSTPGRSRRPSTSITARNAATLPSVVARSSQSEPLPGWSAPADPPRTGARAGSRTRTKTTTRSSTTSHPTAIRPFTELSSPRASRARSSTTVLATDRESPSTSASPKRQPQSSARPRPRTVAAAIWTRAPGTAMRRTSSRSRSEKCRPTPNIISMTPISASWPARSRSATNPGVAGPMTMPATR